MARTTTPHQHVKYPALADALRKAGWRRQENEWRHAGQYAGTHHVEWWNRGSDLLTVYVVDGAATVFLPATIARMQTAIRPTPQRATVRRDTRPRCADCGKRGETTGHQDCQFPQDH